MGVDQIRQPTEDHREWEPDIRGYELRGEIGAGAFGVVYRAFQPVIGRSVQSSVRNYLRRRQVIGRNV